MYIPPVFKVEDRAILDDFIERYSFAMLITNVDGVPFTSHLPMLLDRDGGLLLGHLARANPHWHGFDGKRQGLVIFSGPHAYISPSWYVASPAVPTWNYAAVHVYGAPRVIDDQERLTDLLNRLINRYESGTDQPWKYDLPADYRQKMERAVVGIEIPIARIEGKFKFGQNRSAEDRRSMMERLQAGGAEDRALAAIIKEYAPA
jgi:transcriptional regulator